MTLAVRSALAAIMVTAMSSATFAEFGKWDHSANVKEAATRLAVLHQREGSAGVLKFLDACYRTHLLASAFSEGLEACMAQDYMHSQVLAMIYAKVPADELAKRGAPSPEVIAESMRQRFTAAFTQYNVAAADIASFKSLVETRAMPVFLKGVFPKAVVKRQGPPESGHRK